MNVLVTGAGGMVGSHMVELLHNRGDNVIGLWHKNKKNIEQVRLPIRFVQCDLRYGQAIDTERDSKDAIDDTSIPEALKEKAEEYSRNLMNLEGSHKKQGKITQSYRELGKKLRESKKQNRGGD